METNFEIDPNISGEYNSEKNSITLVFWRDTEAGGQEIARRESFVLDAFTIDFNGTRWNK
jgi:hypothetical protein